jgi:hypothetical protein
MGYWMDDKNTSIARSKLPEESEGEMTYAGVMVICRRTYAMARPQCFDSMAHIKNLSC